jgi:hypothetical protein
VVGWRKGLSVFGLPHPCLLDTLQDLPDQQAHLLTIGRDSDWLVSELGPEPRAPASFFPASWRALCLQSFLRGFILPCLPTSDFLA